MMNNEIENTINSKETFRKVCMDKLHNIRKSKLPELKENSDKCAVFIDCRILPHTEYIIRQVCLCLDDTWSMTFFCGNKNYDYYKGLCETIHKNIKIKKLGVDNMMIDEYSRLLLSKSFWNKINAEKILIFQEDSILFNKGINKFLKYDYIGAPWPEHLNIAPNSVGNGGLSLRSKSKMLEIIDNYSPEDIQKNISESTKSYMLYNNLKLIPEDVYFSHGMHLIGANMPTFEVAKEFSVECMFHPVPLGGHQFWLSNNGCALAKYLK